MAVAEHTDKVTEFVSNVNIQSRHTMQTGKLKAEGRTKRVTVVIKMRKLTLQPCM